MVTSTLGQLFKGTRVLTSSMSASGSILKAATQQQILATCVQQRAVVCAPPLLLPLRCSVCGRTSRQLKPWRAFNNDQQPTAVDSLEDLEIAVPADQRPARELASLKQAFLYDWVRRGQSTESARQPMHIIERWSSCKSSAAFGTYPPRRMQYP